MRETSPSAAMDPGFLLNPVNQTTPRQELRIPTTAASDPNTFFQHRSRQTISPSAHQALIQQEYPPINAPDGYVARATTSQYLDVAKPVSQPSKMYAANSGGQRTPASESQLDMQFNDAPRFESSSPKDVTTPPITARIVTPSHNANVERGKAVRYTAKRQRIEGVATHLTADQTCPPLDLGTSRPAAGLGQTKVPQPNLPESNKRISRAAALGIGLGARSRKFGLEGRIAPTEPYATVANKMRGYKRKRAKPRAVADELELETTGFVWRPNFGLTEVGTYSGWTAYKRVED
jgi:hypothetical protein